MAIIVHKEINADNLKQMEPARFLYCYNMPETCAGCGDACKDIAPTLAATESDNPTLIPTLSDLAFGQLNIVVPLPMCQSCQDRSTSGGIGGSVGCGIGLFFGVFIAGSILAPSVGGVLIAALVWVAALAVGIGTAVYLVRSKRKKILDPSWSGSPHSSFTGMDLLLDVPNQVFVDAFATLNPHVEVKPSQRKTDSVDSRVGLVILNGYQTRVEELLRNRD